MASKIEGLVLRVDMLRAGLGHMTDANIALREHITRIEANHREDRRAARMAIHRFEKKIKALEARLDAIERQAADKKP